MAADKTPKIARAFDKARRKAVPGARCYLLTRDPKNHNRLTAMRIGIDPNGLVKSGWLTKPVIPRTDNLVLRIAELAPYTPSRLERVFGFAVWLADEAVARVFRVVTPVAVPSIPVAREWQFQGTAHGTPFELVEGTAAPYGAYHVLGVY